MTQQDEPSDPPGSGHPPQSRSGSQFPSDYDPIAARVASLRWSTAIVLTGFVVNASIVVLIVSAISDSVVTALVAVAIMVGVILASALYHEALMLWRTGARPIQTQEYPWLQPMVAELARDAGVREPAVYICEDDDDLNAFTTGLGGNTKVVFLTGLLRKLSRDEVRAVAAHELGHIVNRDIALLVWTNAISFWVLAISFLAQATVVLLFAFGKEAPQAGGGGTGAIAGGILAIIAFSLGAFLWLITTAWTVVAQLSRLAVSRQREFLADTTAVAMIGDPDTLSRALSKIAERPHLLRGAAVAGSSCILSPFTEGGWWNELTSTHPLPERRIEALGKLSGTPLSLPPRREGVDAISVVLPVGSMALLVAIALIIPLLLTSGGSATDDHTFVPTLSPPISTSTRTPRQSPQMSTATPTRSTSTPTPVPNGAPITYGKEVTGQITAGQTTSWSFTAKKGEIVTIRVFQEGGASLVPKVRLADPSGKELKSECQNAGPPAESRIQNFELPFDGLYTIFAGGCYSDSAGGYRLTLALKPPPGQIGYGEKAGGQILVTKDYDLWQFTGKMGDIITVRMMQAGGASLPPRLKLLDPSGTELKNECRNIGPEPEARIQNYELMFDGAYTIQASGCYDESLGGYETSLALKPLPGQIAYGQVVAGDIDVTRDYDDWQFTGQAGDVITIVMVQAGGASLPPRIRLIDPSGAEIRNECQNVQQGKSSIQAFELRFPGTYTIRVNGCYDESLGAYNLSLSQ